MTQKDKELLLKDLSARLPYGVIINVNGEKDTLLELGADTGWVNASYDIDDVKPYLRPMSSMTEEEKHNLLKFGGLHISESEEVIDVSCLGFERHCEVQDYLNAHHLDYRGLIEKGLAIAVTEENNPYV